MKNEETIEAFVDAFEYIGYARCNDGKLEDDKVKVALYARREAGKEVPTHAARQLVSGEWTSKLGDYEDIKHSTPEDVRSDDYGRVICYLSRPRSSKT